jgi:uncharacterized protein
MEFEWDLVKARTNRKKHGVDFADAVEVFFDRLALTIPDDRPTEERYVTVGTDALSRVLVVAHSWRDARVRVISARKADRTERLRYEEHK